jgi:hypothetical protein
MFNGRLCVKLRASGVFLGVRHPSLLVFPAVSKPPAYHGRTHTDHCRRLSMSNQWLFGVSVMVVVL